MILSYIITTHNRPALLPQAVAFVAAERCVDSELIIVDDASESPATMPALAGMAFPNACRLIRNAVNLGVIGARNAGIKAAQGEFIIFLDDDDESLPNRSRDLLGVIAGTNLDFVAGRSFMRTGNSEKTTPATGGFLLTPTELLLHPPHIDAVIWRRESLLATDGLDQRVPYLGEHITLMLLLLRGSKGWLSEAVVARFGYIEDGLTQHTQQSARMKANLLAFYAVLRQESSDPEFSVFCESVLQMIDAAPIQTFDDYLEHLRALTATQP